MAPCILTAPPGAGGAPPGGDVAVLFGCEWRHSTGTTEAAFRDGTRWPAYNGVLSNGSASIDAPDASLAGRGNYFRITNNGENNLTVRHDTLVPASTTHWGRVYVRDQRTTGLHNHWIAMGGLGTGGDIEFAVGTITIAGTRRVQLYGANDASGGDVVYPWIRWAPGNVDNANAYDPLGTGWYLLEWQVQYLTATTFRLGVWLNEVDSTGTMTTADKWTASRFYGQDYAGQAGRDLATAQVAQDYFGLSAGGGPTGARQYVFGNEGPGGNVTDSGFFLTASFAISTEGRLRDQSLGL